MIEVKRVENCVLNPPSKGTDSSAGFDLSSNEGKFQLLQGEKKLVDTGFCWKIPEGFVGIIKPRSGLAHKHGIDILAGVIDSDYRGEVKVIMQNHGRKTVNIDWRDRIAQMVVIPISISNAVIEVAELDDSVRGDGGFGSTGK